MASPVKMKLTAKKPVGFYVRAAATFLRGTDDEHPVAELELSALGSAIGAAVEVAARMEGEKMCTITKIQSLYPDMDGESHSCAQVVISLKNSEENMKNKPKNALSEKSIEIVQATAGVVAENASKITTCFYSTMFKNNPEAAHFFNKTNQGKGMQQDALAHAVVAYASNITNLAVLDSAVKKICHRHVALAVTPNLYSIVHDNLMQAIGEVLGAAVTPEIGAAWSEAVMALAKICINTEEKMNKAAEKRSGGWRGEREFVLKKKTEKAGDVIAFDFAAADGYKGGYEYTPGQYLTIRVEGIAPRHYTITSASGAKTLQCTTRKVDPVGAVSSFMHETMKVGDKVLLGPPSGVFVPCGKDDKVVLISAGIGITPMWAFLQHFGKKHVKLAMHFEKSPEKHAYKSEFEKAGVTCKDFYTQTTGRPDVAKEVTDACAEVGTDAAYYICGPIPWMDTVSTALKKEGAVNVFMEKFGTG